MPQALSYQDPRRVARPGGLNSWAAQAPGLSGPCYLPFHGGRAAAFRDTAKAPPTYGHLLSTTTNTCLYGRRPATSYGHPGRHTIDSWRAADPPPLPATARLPPFPFQRTAHRCPIQRQLPTTPAAGHTATPVWRKMPFSLFKTARTTFHTNRRMLFLPTPPTPQDWAAARTGMLTHTTTSDAPVGRWTGRALADSPFCQIRAFSFLTAWAGGEDGSLLLCRAGRAFVGTRLSRAFRWALRTHAARTTRRRTCHTPLQKA